MKHTKGKWEARGNFVYLKNETHEIARVITHNNNEEESKANAKLIAEAGTVSNETGKTPRQLADENKELLGALIKSQSTLKSLKDKLEKPQYGIIIGGSLIESNEQIIGKATQ